MRTVLSISLPENLSKELNDLAKKQAEIKVIY